MTTDSDIHGYTMPTPGDTDDWGSVLNSLIDDELEQEVPVYGTYANRPTAGDTDLELYVATDRKILYHNGGTSWTAVSGVGTSSNPLPEQHVDKLSVGSEAGLPKYDDKANAPTTEGSTIWITGNGATTPAGVYRYDGSQYELIAVAGVDGQAIAPQSVTAEVATLDQQADDGTDRFVVQRADGTEMAEIYSDGTNTVINPLTGNVDVPGAISADEVNPDAIARSPGLYQNFTWQSLDGIPTTTSGGTVSVAYSQLRLSPGSTSGDWCRASPASASYGSGGALSSFDKSIVMKGSISIDGGDGSRVSYYTVGQVQKGNQGFGFKIANGDLLGVSNDGSSESTTTLISSPGTGVRQVTAVFEPGTDVTFYVDGMGTADGTVSTNLPSGTDNRAGLVQAYAETQTNADRRLRVFKTEVGQAP